MIAKLALYFWSMMLVGYSAVAAAFAYHKMSFIVMFVVLVVLSAVKHVGTLAVLIYIPMFFKKKKPEQKANSRLGKLLERMHAFGDRLLSRGNKASISIVFFHAWCLFFLPGICLASIMSYELFGFKKSFLFFMIASILTSIITATVIILIF